jgi:hypothetical protein
MTYRFINESFEKEIYNVIHISLPSLNEYDSNILLKYLSKLINIVAYCFFKVSDYNNFTKQLRQNNYRDVQGFLYMLLPYLNDDKSSINSFIHMTTANKNNQDLNTSQPKYLYSNIQYNRCIRDDPIHEIKFNEENIRQNFYLLVDTLRLSSNKLYVNWINIIPITKSEITGFGTIKQDLYCKQTIDWFNAKQLKYVNTNDLLEMDDNQLRNELTHLQLDDIYDTISNEFYNAIKSVKWLIYDIIINTKEIIPLLVILCNIFHNDFNGCLNNCLNNIDWFKLDKSKQETFSKEWDNLVIQDFTPNPSIIFTPTESDKIRKSIVIFFDNYYKDKDLAIDDGYIPLTSIIDMEKKDEDEIDEIKFNKNILRSLKSIPYKHIYNFFKDSFQILKNSVMYSKEFMYVRDNKLYFASFANSILLYNTPDYTSKNLYNYAKSLCHYTNDNGEYTQYPRYWKSLTTNNKNKIIDRLNDKNNTNKWFNISSYLKNKLYLPINQIDAKNIEIYNQIQKIIIKQVLYCFVFRGILSKFTFNLDLTDTNIIPSDKQRRVIPLKLKDIIFNNEDIKKNSYYYLTSTPYENVKNNINNNESESKLKYIDYFKYNSLENNGWYMAYALNWVSQLNFFHKYLNNRVLYVTGSTGVGKSTQIPKLLLYALKAIDYNNTGSIVCTQPRKSPTKGNAETISTELGIPISHKVKYKQEDLEKNFESYVQYKHSTENNVKPVNTLSLKIVTDGTLDAELSNPLLKKLISNIDNDKKLFSNQNIYDIVIVDEAHEHNANMDIILTYMKIVAHYNNSIKLVIISATMDDDEPIYRRYYRDINDNRMYPLSNSLKELQLDRINVDRRLHISPPGETTSYKITDIYLSENPIKDKLDLTLNIINSTADGYVLLFEPGLAEITASVEKLNKYLPENSIAIPYHSQLSEKNRNIVENLTDTLKNIRIGKDVPFDKSDPEKGMRHYDRAVIVATNIAEASITISKLRYVIETGTQKTAKYNYKKQAGTITLTKISESSRLQRRGRVGRVAPGTVYYLYNKGERENEMQQYPISVKNISDQLYKRLYESSDDILILSSLNDPNNPSIEINSSSEAIKEQYLYNIDAMIFDQYFTDGIFFDYFGDESQYDYRNMKSPVNIYLNGVEKETLNDPYGIFYIIHPEELNLVRNITGKIVGILPTSENISYQNNKVISYKITSFWDTLADSFYLIDYYDNDKNITYKTPFGKDMMELQTVLEIGDMDEGTNSRLFISYMYSRVYGCDEQMIRFIALKTSMGKFTSDFTTSYYLPDGRFRTNSNKIKQYVGTEATSSDILSLLSILDELHNLVPINMDTEILFSKYRYNKQQLQNTNNQYNDLSIKKLEIEINELINKQLDRNINMKNDTLDIDEYYILRSSNIINKIVYKNLLINYKTKITEWCEKRYLKLETILNYLAKYIDLTNRLYCIKHNKLEKKLTANIDNVTSIIKNKLINTPMIDQIDNFSKALIMGFYRNIVKNIDTSSYYLNIIDPSLDNVSKLSSLDRSGRLLDTFVEPKYTKNYLLYISTDIEKNTISLLHYISPKIFKYMSYIFNIAKLRTIYESYLQRDIEVSGLNDTIEYKFIGAYKSTLKSTLHDIINNYDPTIWIKIAEMESHIKDYAFKQRSLMTGGYISNNENKLDIDILLELS